MIGFPLTCAAAFHVALFGIVALQFDERASPSDLGTETIPTVLLQLGSTSAASGSSAASSSVKPSVRPTERMSSTPPAANEPSSTHTPLQAVQPSEMPGWVTAQDRSANQAEQTSGAAGATTKIQDGGPWAQASFFAAAVARSSQGGLRDDHDCFGSTALAAAGPPASKATCNGTKPRPHDHA